MGVGMYYACYCCLQTKGDELRQNSIGDIARQRWCRVQEDANSVVLTSCVQHDESLMVFEEASGAFEASHSSANSSMGERKANPAKKAAKHTKSVLRMLLSCAVIRSRGIVLPKCKA
eukprot:1958975-Amphidinium_carterae.1